MDTTTPSPSEKTVRQALLDALRKQGLDPQDDWISVRHGKEGKWIGMYMVIVASHEARVLLSEVLPRSGKTIGNEVAGVWVLEEREVRELCE